LKYSVILLLASERPLLLSIPSKEKQSISITGSIFDFY